MLLGIACRGFAAGAPAVCSARVFFHARTLLLVAVCGICLMAGCLSVAAAEDCDDGNPCTVDTWNPLTQQCEHALVDCSHLNDQCNTGAYDPATCNCIKQPKPNETPCNDGNCCTVNDICINGVCQGTPVDCEDGILCTAGTYNCVTNTCLQTPNHAVCDDGNPATIDTCDPVNGDPVTGCVHTSAGDYMVGDAYPLWGDLNGDGDSDDCGEFGDESISWIDVISVYYCFIGVSCPQPGSARYDAMDSYPPDEVDQSCNSICRGGDGVVDWMDLIIQYYRFIVLPTCWVRRQCEPLPECVFDEDCDDGLWCNGAETCVCRVCQPGIPPNCDDGVGCTVDSCNETTDSCDHIPDDSLCAYGQCIWPSGVVVPGVEGGCWLLDTGVGTYELQGEIDFGSYAGQHVTILGEPQPDMASSCMQGPIIFVCGIWPC